MSKENGAGFLEEASNISFKGAIVAGSLWVIEKLASLHFGNELLGKAAVGLAGAGVIFRAAKPSHS